MSHYQTARVPMQEANTRVVGKYEDTDCCDKVTLGWWQQDGFFTIGKRHVCWGRAGDLEAIDETHWRRRGRARAPRRSR
jgi:hypothetical protein